MARIRANLPPEAVIVDNYMQVDLAGYRVWLHRDRDWQTVRVNLSDFGPTDYTAPLSSFADMEDLLFTFDVGRSGKTGAVYLDHVALQ
jgi:hypothetical protein